MPTFPFPGMPYGPAPSWTLHTAELSIFALFFLCLLHAARAGRRSVAYLLGGLAFGLVLEYIEVISHSYTYGHFWIMLGRSPYDIPLNIGCGWAIIMYSARLFSDGLRLAPLSAAALDTLLALNIDLSLDVVAYRMHMWHWYWNGTGLAPLTAQWFGIPYGNFIGWATVVFCYSYFSGLFERRLADRAALSTARVICVAFLALLASQIVLFTSETWIFGYLSRHFGLNSARRLILIAIVMTCLATYGILKRPRPAQQIPGLALWVPGWFHLFCITSFFGLGFFRENKWMTVIACANVAAGFAIHFYPWTGTQRSFAVEGAAESGLLETEAS